MFDYEDIPKNKNDELVALKAQEVCSHMVDQSWF